MPKKNNGYWKKRQEKLQRSLLEPADKYCDELEKAYKSTIKDIEKEIAVWYQRFADNNGIVDKAEAKKILNNKELKELKWDVEQYIKAGEENGITKNWAKELENASAKFHISRLDALKLQTQQKIEELYGGREDKVKSLLGDTYTEGSYRNAYEIAQKTGASFNFAKIDDNKLNKVLSKPWTTDNNTFSDRIWQNRVTLVNTVHQELIKGISRGSSSIDIAKAISKKMDSDLWQAQRLVVTESAFFASEAQKDCYNSLDVEKYQVLGTLDSTTCSECGSMDGQVFDTKDMQEGINAPPFHPNCRCTTVPYFDDEFTEKEMRATRDDDGKTTYVKDMSYKEWKGKYVVNEQLEVKIEQVNKQLEDLKTQFSKITDGYSYDDWFIDFDSIEDGYGSTYDDNYTKLKSIDEKIKKLEQQRNIWQLELKEKIVEDKPSELRNLIQQKTNVKYEEVHKLLSPLSEKEIISKLGGGDLTGGSCSSLSFAYIGNKNGLDVTDFRGGESRSVFADKLWTRMMLDLNGVSGSVTKVTHPIKDTMDLLNSLPIGKEYRLSVAKHTAIVKRTESGVQYLELQSAKNNGWKSFDEYGSMPETLNRRFGCKKNSTKLHGRTIPTDVVLMDVDSFANNDEFRKILGYLNTKSDKQKKGLKGFAK